MSTIKVLPQSITNKIAAGEVIERPASVVKELLENAIDANPTRIEIQLEDGGKKLIRVTDDGEGMDAEDVSMAFLSHATSKLKTADDLFAISTMGFRGEALPSIGEISQARIISRRQGELSGAEIEIDGGKLGTVKEKGAPEGTTVEVSNLFFNTPVRQKFLKTTATEMGHITDIITRIALARPQVAFELTHNSRRVYALPACEDLRERISMFFGRELADDLIDVEAGQQGMRLSGFLSPPHHSRANTKMQFIFLNGRFIRDKGLSHAINEAYRRMLADRRFPITFLFLEIASNDVDVNVHPTKIEVRFRRARQVHDLILTALRERLRSSDLTANFAAPQTHADPAVTKQKKNISRAIVEYFESKAKPPPQRSLWKEPSAAAPQKAHNAPAETKTPAASQTSTRPAPPTPTPATVLRHFFQFHNSYIVEEVETGINIIDQHALHERILYEKITGLTSGGLENQRLLIPEVIELSNEETVRLMAAQSVLKQIGIEIEEFGQNTVAVQAVPYILRNSSVKELMKDIVADLTTAGESAEAEKQLEALAETAACHGAIKAGQRLSDEEIKALLDERDQLGPPAVCPHGRPSTLNFSLSDLEKQFGRK